ncbi:MAG: DUF2252 domain-containing protein [Rhodospirillales bacterium]|nr:DUF2252 domain-containing protein [Rhodospirillales bacterium]
MTGQLTMRAANAGHEAFLAAHCDAVQADLAFKRTAMAESSFAFLRATCFRFAARFASIAPLAAGEFAVPSVGDAHLENFGTWRDAEGRLVWGVNDLDEAAMLPWRTDLLRLACSAILAMGAPDTRLVQDTLLSGYAAGLARPGPFILDERNARLRDVAAPTPDERVAFWAKIDRMVPCEPPPAIRAALLAALPPGCGAVSFAPRVAGLGSLGRPRFVAIAQWRGGRVVREAKSKLPSAWIEAGFQGAAALDVAGLALNPHRAPDPWLTVTQTLVTRRLAPDSRKLDISPRHGRAFLAVLSDMGSELANIHSSQEDAARLTLALAASQKHWLAEGAQALAEAVMADFGQWRKVMEKGF